VASKVDVADQQGKVSLIEDGPFSAIKERAAGRIRQARTSIKEGEMTDHSREVGKTAHRGRCDPSYEEAASVRYLRRGRYGLLVRKVPIT